MSYALRELNEAVEILSDESRVLELAVRAMHEACERATAFGMTSRGEQAQRLGSLRLVADGELITLAPSHLAYVRTPAYDLAGVPESQRNVWIEPFREGIATLEGWKKSTIYPLVAKFGIDYFGRVSVCSGSRQVALIGSGISGGGFSDAERARLIEATVALIVPVRMAALIANATHTSSPLEQMLDSSTEVILAVDERGGVVGSSRAGFQLLRVDRKLPEQLRDTVRSLARPAAIVRDANRVLHVSPCRQGSIAYLIVVDGARFAEEPVEISPRQRELLELLARGLSNAQIGAAMGISPATVKTMLERLYKRAGVANRVELLGWARSRTSGSML